MHILYRDHTKTKSKHHDSTASRGAQPQMVSLTKIKETEHNNTDEEPTFEMTPAQSPNKEDLNNACPYELSLLLGLMV